MATRVIKIEEVSEVMSDGDTLCFQYTEYQYDDGGSDNYYRFIRKSPEGNYKAQRGQAGIIDLNMAERLIKAMKKIRKI